MIDHVRYGFAVLSLITLPPGLFYWFVIHPWARWWRRLGPVRTYLLVLPVMAIFGALLFRVRVRLLGTDLGVHWVLICIAALLYAAVAWLEIQYWKHLNFATVTGLQELLPEHRKGKLLREGIYGTVRHPRYLSAGIGVIANAFVVDYAGVYLLISFLFPVGFAMLALEERELVDRFGEEYRQYQRDVPRIIPRRQRAKSG